MRRGSCKCRPKEYLLVRGAVRLLCFTIYTIMLVGGISFGRLSCIGSLRRIGRDKEN